MVVKAPLSSTLDAVEEKVKKRARWIRRQLNFFNQFIPRTPERRYVGGESHLYLGRRYRLKIELPNMPTMMNKVVLRGGYFYIPAARDSPERIKRLLECWYKERAEKIFPVVLNDCWKALGRDDLSKPVSAIRKMDKRWGSLSGRGRLTLNRRLIQAPRGCIEYVVMHELCHLIHHNHGRDFYRLLDRKMPDWRKRKQRLELTMA